MTLSYSSTVLFLAIATCDKFLEGGSCDEVVCLVLVSTCSKLGLACVPFLD